MLTTITNTPSSMLILPEKSDNNLEMYSDSYDMYTISMYFSYFLTAILWIFWLIGLFLWKSSSYRFYFGNASNFTLCSDNWNFAARTGRNDAGIIRFLLLYWNLFKRLLAKTYLSKIPSIAKICQHFSKSC